jgi:hypothetical protein
MSISASKQEPDLTDSQHASKGNVIGQPTEIQESYISKPVGISAFKEDYAEVQSPYRKRRGTLQKLNTGVYDGDEGEKGEKEACFKKLEPIFAAVLQNFADKQNELQRLKSLSLDEKISLFKAKELQGLSQSWQKGLEMHVPETLSVPEPTIGEFKK